MHYTLQPAYRIHALPRSLSPERALIKACIPHTVVTPQQVLCCTLLEVPAQA